MYIESVAAAEFVLKGTGQIPPFKWTRLQSAIGVDAEEGVRSTGANPSRFWFGRASIHHRFDEGSGMSRPEAVPHRVEDIRKDSESFGFVIWTFDFEMVPYHRRIIPPAFPCEESPFSKVLLNLVQAFFFRRV
jgi:hypothetical protein